MQIRITQLDGTLPNLALMKLTHFHKAQGNSVFVTRSLAKSLFEPKADVVYASAIFQRSADRVKRFTQQFPDAIIGGTGTTETVTVEEAIGLNEYEHYDYEGWPEFDASIGFTQRGCRLKCAFCVVPKKEGRARSVNTVYNIWRGGSHPKKLHILDNDFFGQPVEAWRERIQEMKDGQFKVCMSQGINVRMITDEAAAALASIEYRDSSFSRRRLYTAWDNLGDEKLFFRGVEKLSLAGIPPTHVMAYMLIGYDICETWESIWHRFNRMVDLGILPYPMVFDRRRTDLVSFQRWVITGLYRIVPWPEYRLTKSAASIEAYRFNQAAAEAAVRRSTSINRSQV